MSATEQTDDRCRRCEDGDEPYRDASGILVHSTEGECGICVGSDEPHCADAVECQRQEGDEG